MKISSTLTGLVMVMVHCLASPSHASLHRTKRELYRDNVDPNDGGKIPESYHLRTELNKIDTAGLADPRAQRMASALVNTPLPEKASPGGAAAGFPGGSFGSYGSGLPPVSFFPDPLANHVPALGYPAPEPYHPPAPYHPEPEPYHPPAPYHPEPEPYHPPTSHYQPEPYSPPHNPYSPEPYSPPAPAYNPYHPEPEQYQPYQPEPYSPPAHSSYQPEPYSPPHHQGYTPEPYSPPHSDYHDSYKPPSSSYGPHDDYKAPNPYHEPHKPSYKPYKPVGPVLLDKRPHEVKEIKPLPVTVHQTYTTFDCRRAPYPDRHYADPEAGCSIYHFCHANGKQDTFHCPKGTIFNEYLGTCDHSEAVYCKGGNGYAGPALHHDHHQSYHEPAYKPAPVAHHNDYHSPPPHHSVHEPAHFSAYEEDYHEPAPHYAHDYHEDGDSSYHQLQPSFTPNFDFPKKFPSPF